jgi:hypothetical protein
MGDMSKPDQEADNEEQNQKSDKKDWRLRKHCVLFATVVF